MIKFTTRKSASTHYYSMDFVLSRAGRVPSRTHYCKKSRKHFISRCYLSIFILGLLCSSPPTPPPLVEHGLLLLLNSIPSHMLKESIGHLFKRCNFYGVGLMFCEPLSINLGRPYAKTSNCCSMNLSCILKGLGRFDGISSSHRCTEAYKWIPINGEIWKHPEAKESILIRPAPTMDSHRLSL